MLRAYSNNGVNFRPISQASDAQTGEVVLNWEPDLQVTEAQLEAAFPGRAAALAAQDTATMMAQQQSAAQGLLDKSDVTFLRAQEAGQSWPAAWVAYRTALRAVAKSGGDLPTLPATYPDGTST